MQRVDLLSLPEDMLRKIAEHFDLAEWVRAPAQACRLFHRMELRSVEFDYLKAEPVKLDHVASNRSPLSCCLAESVDPLRSAA